MNSKSKKLRISLIVIASLLVLGGAGAAAYHFDLAPGFFKLIPGLNAKYKDTNGTGDDAAKPNSTGTAYKEAFQKNKVKVEDLAEAGDQQSVEQADKIVESEVKSADKSGNDDYIVDANLSKAELLINTGRSQEAIDDVLLPLLEKYGNNEKYKYQIYSLLSWAYRQIGNVSKSEEYYDKIPDQGWN